MDTDLDYFLTWMFLMFSRKSPASVAVAAALPVAAVAAPAAGAVHPAGGPGPAEEVERREGKERGGGPGPAEEEERKERREGKERRGGEAGADPARSVKSLPPPELPACSLFTEAACV